MTECLAFTGKQQLTFEEITHSTPLAATQVRAKAICSLMSTGTENIVYNRLFDAGTHWDNWVKYPFHPGYAWIGCVTEVGADVDKIKVGDRVAMRKGHAEEHIEGGENCMLLPDNLDPEKAAWFALAKICYSGAMAAEYKLGSKVLIIGGGPIGQMTLRWARSAGAGKIVMVEPIAMRQKFAIQGGAHHCINKRIDEAHADITAAFDGEQPEIIIDGTGNAAVFQECLKACAHSGTVVILGDTGSPSSQHLSTDVINRRIHIVGAHDCNYPTPPPVHLFFSLLNDKRFNVDDLITHRFAFKDAKEAYTIANEKRGETMGILFTYPE